MNQKFRSQLLKEQLLVWREWGLDKILKNAYENGTIFVITTQICTNDGVCDPPVPHEGVVEDHNYAISIKPKSDHTYVNWRVNAEYENGDEENFPKETGSKHGHLVGLTMMHGVA